MWRSKAAAHFLRLARRCARGSIDVRYLILQAFRAANALPDEQTQLLLDRLVIAAQSWICGDLDDLGMELPVSLVIGALIRDLARLFEVVVNRLKSCDLFFGDATCGQAPGDPCQSRTNVIKVEGVLEADLADENTTVADDLDQPGLLQRPRRLANRTAADVQAGGKSVFVQSFAGRDLAIEDHALDLVAHKRRQ
jgi:hypothetical protein